MTWSFRNLLLAGLAVSVILAFGVSRFASSKPDGLERVAATHALDTGEREHALADAPLADYATRGIDDAGLSTGTAGVIGVAVCFLVAFLVSRLAAARARPAGTGEPVEVGDTPGLP